MSEEDPPRTAAPVLMMQRPPDSPGPSLSQTADRRGTYATSRRETRDLAAARLTSMPRIEREGLGRSRDFGEERRNFSAVSQENRVYFLDNSIRAEIK